MRRTDSAALFAHVMHIRQHDVSAVFAYDSMQLFDAARAGGDLGLDVADVLIDVSRRKWALREQLAECLFAESAVFDEQEVVDEHAFLAERGAVWRHGAGRHSTDVGVMTARGHVEQGIVSVVVEHRHHDGHVGQVRAAVIRIVERVHVAGTNAASIPRHRRARE